MCINHYSRKSGHQHSCSRTIGHDGTVRPCFLAGIVYYSVRYTDPAPHLITVDPDHLSTVDRWIVICPTCGTSTRLALRYRAEACVRRHCNSKCPRGAFLLWLTFHERSCAAGCQFITAENLSQIEYSSSVYLAYAQGITAGNKLS